MLKILIVIHCYWLICIVAYQFSNYHKQFIGTRMLGIFISPLMPFWHFFAPNPLASDFSVEYKVIDIDKKNILEDTYEISPQAKLYSIFYNNKKLEVKLFVNTCKAVVSNFNPANRIAMINFIVGLVDERVEEYDKYCIIYEVIEQNRNDRKVLFTSDLYTIKR